MRKLTHSEISRNRLGPGEVENAPRLPVFGLLDNIRSLYNVGSIFRSSDGAFLSHLFLTGYTPHPPRKEINKTALGATKTIPWSYHRDPMEAVADARARGARICVLEHTSGSIPYYEVKPEWFPVCLVIGNELTGVSPELIAAADVALEIPMFGTKQSLNAAVAFGIAVFELGRIFRKVPGRG